MLIELAVLFLVLALVAYILGARGIAGFFYGYRKVARHNLRHRRYCYIHIVTGSSGNKNRREVRDAVQ